LVTVRLAEVLTVVWAVDVSLPALEPLVLVETLAVLLMVEPSVSLLRLRTTTVARSWSPAATTPLAGVPVTVPFDWE
jgi:hypothetical protein